MSTVTASSMARTITLKDAAALLGVDRRTVSEGVKNGTIPAIRLGRRVVIPRAKFMAMLGEQEPAND